MWREKRIGPLLPPGPNHGQRTAPVMHLRRWTLLCLVRSPRGARAGFTLVELLTVITIIAILATLLMTTLSSVKRKAREAVCTSNLHQIGIALHLYLEDFGKRPANLAMLATAKYLGDGRILVCPADRQGGIPAVLSDVKSSFSPGSESVPPPLPVSYQHPLGWSDEDWNRLMQAQTRAGVVVCMFHDIAAPARGAGALGTPSGLILRGQLDGTVLRRRIYPSAAPQEGALPPQDRSASPAVSFGATDSGVYSGAPPWELFSDEPPL